MRVQVGSTGTIQPVDIKTESLHFDKEEILDICEYAENKMIISNYNRSHLFLVDSWKVVHKITDPDSNNTWKRSFTLYPGFNLATLPFIITCGDSSFSIVNVAQAHEDVLIKEKTSTIRGQTACFFTTDDDETATMHFTTTSPTKEGAFNQIWHTMSFKEDFRNILE